MLEGGIQAPGLQPDFQEITCPKCRKRMVAGHENIAVLYQGEDDPLARIYMHVDCLIVYVEELKQQYPGVVRR